jgi:hypothetical protein
MNAATSAPPIAVDVAVVLTAIVRYRTSFMSPHFCSCFASDWPIDFI